MLSQLTRVSKDWHKIIVHPVLAHMQVQHATNTENPVILHTSRPINNAGLVRFYLLKEDGNLLKTANSPLAKLNYSQVCMLQNSCNGLLCCMTSSDCAGIIVLNPFISGEVVRVPPPTNKIACIAKTEYGLGFDCLTNTYKIVCVFVKDVNREIRSLKLGVKSVHFGY